jgi:hypothetical protein
MRWSHLTAIAFSVSFIAMGDASMNSASVSFRTKSQISSCLTSPSSSPSSSYRWNSNHASVAIFSSCRSILQNIPRGGEALTENTIETSEEEGVSSDLNSETEASTNTDKRITKKAAKKVKTKKTKIKDSKSTTQETVNTVLEGKKVIQDALNEKDAAQALGDAIRYAICHCITLFISSLLILIISYFSLSIQIIIYIHCHTNVIWTFVGNELMIGSNPTHGFMMSILP